jgi:hypothetical protein
MTTAARGEEQSGGCDSKRRSRGQILLVYCDQGRDSESGFDSGRGSGAARQIIRATPSSASPSTMGDEPPALGRRRCLVQDLAIRVDFCATTGSGVGPRGCDSLSRHPTA